MTPSEMNDEARRTFARRLKVSFLDAINAQATASGGEAGPQCIMQLLRFSPLPETVLDELKEINMKFEADIRLKCIELALAAAPGGSTERAIAAAQAYFDFVTARSPATPERTEQPSSDTLRA